MPKAHTIRQLLIAKASCACGWTFSNHLLKGKKDEDLVLENYAEWEKHRDVFSHKKRT